MSLLSKATTHLFFVYHSGELAAWSVTPPTAINRLSLNGEESLKISTGHGLNEGFKDAIARLRSAGTTPDFVHWIIADQEAEVLLKSNLLSKEIPWQILNWDWLSGRFALEQTPLKNTPALESQVFTWLVTANEAKEREAMQQALNKEYQSQAEQISQEHTHLKQQNELLRSQNATLQNVDTESLVRFLPALFPRVFTVLGAVDLALLCGRVEPLAIRNPYPEPSEETLYRLQKDFRSLPKTLQKQIVGLVARLPQRKNLKPRSEMRNLIAELEED